MSTNNQSSDLGTKTTAKPSILKTKNKQIEDINGKTVVSEGVEANYMDMANYALFALILSSEGVSV